MRRLGMAALVLVVAGAAFAATWWVLTSPQYTVYQLMESLNDRDSRRFLAYVDLSAVLLDQQEALATVYLPQLKKQPQTQEAVTGMVKALMPMIQMQVRKEVARTVEDPQRPDIPHPMLLAMATDIEVAQDNALVSLESPEDHQTVRLGLKLYPDQRWRVASVNPEDLKRILIKHWPQAHELGLDAQ